MASSVNNLLGPSSSNDTEVLPTEVTKPSAAPLFVVPSVPAECRFFGCAIVPTEHKVFKCAIDNTFGQSVILSIHVALGRTIVLANDTAIRHAIAFTFRRSLNLSAQSCLPRDRVLTTTYAKDQALQWLINNDDLSLCPHEAAFHVALCLGRLLVYLRRTILDAVECNGSDPFECQSTRMSVARRTVRLESRHYGIASGQFQCFVSEMAAVSD
jgi:hypothetical protein